MTDHTDSLFYAFLEHNQPDPASRKRLQRLSGLASARKRTTPIVHFGPGATGKTTFQRIIQAADPRGGYLHETANVPPAEPDHLGSTAVAWDVVIPAGERDLRLAQKIINGEARIVRDWLAEGAR